MIYSNKDTVRLLLTIGASPKLIADWFVKVVIGSMFGALWKGLIITAVLYLAVSEIAQIWIPVTRTRFLLDVFEAVSAIFVFMALSTVIVRRKIYSLDQNFGR